MITRDVVQPVRLLAAAAALICVVALLIAYFFMERYLLLEPCPLCILDRFAVGAMALGFAVLAAAPRRFALPAWCITTISLVAGFVFALRHIWLQNRPPDSSATCLSDSAAAQNLLALIEQAFDANADCGAIMWEFAGMTIPEQVLVLLIVLALWQLLLAVLLWRDSRAAAAAATADISRTHVAT